MNLDDASGWMPHGFCFGWAPTVFWPMLAGNLLTGLAYYAIPGWMLWLRRRRPDLMPSWFAVSFGLFILLCGTGHLLKLVTLWIAIYRVEAFWDLLTGLDSITVAVLVIFARWRILAVPRAVDVVAAEARAHAAEERAAESLKRAEHLADLLEARDEAESPRAP